MLKYRKYILKGGIVLGKGISNCVINNIDLSNNLYNTFYKKIDNIIKNYDDNEHLNICMKEINYLNLFNDDELKKNFEIFLKYNLFSLNDVKKIKIIQNLKENNYLIKINFNNNITDEILQYYKLKQMFNDDNVKFNNDIYLIIYIEINKENINDINKICNFNNIKTPLIIGNLITIQIIKNLGKSYNNIKDYYDDIKNNNQLKFLDINLKEYNTSISFLNRKINLINKTYEKLDNEEIINKLKNINIKIKYFNKEINNEIIKQINIQNNDKQINIQNNDEQNNDGQNNDRQNNDRQNNDGNLIDSVNKTKYNILPINNFNYNKNYLNINNKLFINVLIDYINTYLDNINKKIENEKYNENIKNNIFLSNILFSHLDICETLQKLFNKNLNHSDIKLDNITYTKIDDKIKSYLIDFTSFIENDKLKNYTPLYTPLILLNLKENKDLNTLFIKNFNIYDTILEFNNQLFNYQKINNQLSNNQLYNTQQQIIKYHDIYSYAVYFIMLYYKLDNPNLRIIKSIGDEILDLLYYDLSNNLNIIDFNIIKIIILKYLNYFNSKENYKYDNNLILYLNKKIILKDKYISYFKNFFNNENNIIDNEYQSKSIEIITTIINKSVVDDEIINDMLIEKNIYLNNIKFLKNNNKLVNIINKLYSNHNFFYNYNDEINELKNFNDIINDL